MRSNRTRHHALCTAVAMAASMLAADISLAQQGIEEIVVTARKREENLQDVPMAISAFTAEQLQNSQVDNITDLQKMTPNITVNETSGLVAGVVQVFIRGIGNDPGFDQGVGIYVDDVYLNTATGALLEVYDVERIEVLKGPQGNLYGRNTIGGAIKYVSREPSNELEAGLEGQLGTDDLLRLRGNVSGPLLEDVLFGGFAFSVKDRDGYQTNQYDGSEWADSDVQAFRGTLLWTPTEDLTLKVVADYSDDQSKPNIPNRVALNVAGINGISTPVTLANTIYGPGTAPFDGASDVSLPPDEDTVNTAHVVNGYDQTELKTSSVAGTITWDVNEAVTLKSVTAFRDVENPRAFDFDGSAQEFINTISSPQNEDFSQEFQFNYASDKLHIVAGAYYLDGSYTIEDPGFTLQTARLRFWSDHRKTTYQTIATSNRCPSTVPRNGSSSRIGSSHWVDATPRTRRISTSRARWSRPSIHSRSRAWAAR
jgi:iron complex outermembrane receptor protein